MSLRRSAFSLLETLVVVTIMAVAVGFSVLYAQTDTVRTDLHTQAAIFSSYLREMQTDAASGKGATSAGIHLETDQYVLFHGASYNALDASNFVVVLPSVIKVTDINLTGGGSEVIFTSPLGETSTAGSLDFSSASTGQTVHITINSLGAVDYE
jgi:prepilin-type N-terminal cleavage/methylation domain-containing protein